MHCVRSIVAHKSSSVSRTLSNLPNRSSSIAHLLSNGWNDNSTSKTQPADSISKTFEFMDFNEAWGFMSKSALLAEKIDHHPEWFNVYNRVEVTLTTHDTNGVSKKDIAMADHMDKTHQ
ncbi:hypothetical protein ScalyP_jg2981 [Parmales sp. scaly parma]|nr:hypothetical protein ScalyP_jg2981 [Parmales sp. scaly parma]